MVVVVVVEEMLVGGGGVGWRGDDQRTKVETTIGKPAKVGRQWCKKTTVLVGYESDLRGGCT